MQRSLTTSLFVGLLFAPLAAAQDAEPAQQAQVPSQSVNVNPPAYLAAGANVTLIFTNIPGFPESQVPGLGGTEFKPGTSTANMDRVFGSPNGNWIITALADLATSDDECLIMNGTLVQQEGQPGAWTGGTENCGTIDQKIGVNDAGDFTFATNTNGTVNDDYIVTNVGGTWGYSAREGDAATQVPGNTFDDLLDSPIILADGTSGFMADGLDGTLTSTTDDFAILGSSVLLQQGVSIPTGQAGGAMETMGFLDFQDFWASADGAHWLVQGDLNGSTLTDDIVVVDGAVVLQEGEIIPGSGFPNPVDGSGIVAVHMDPAGRWFARGNNDSSETDWVVRDGVVLATLGQPIVTGSTELWDDAAFSDCFFLHVGNSHGDYVIGGVTDNADTLLNGVLVLNGTDVICREGDPIDLDGNGAFDDDAFVNTFGNDDAYLSDDGVCYVILTVKDSVGTVRGQAFLAIDTGSGGDGTPFCSPMDTNSTGNSTTLTGSLGSGVESGLNLQVSGGVPSEFGYFLIGTAVDDPGTVISGGRLCLAISGGNQFGRYNFGTTTNSIGAFDASGNFANLVGTATSSGGMGYDVASANPLGGTISSGQTWHFQLWHRDTPAGAGSSNFSNGLSVTFP